MSEITEPASYLPVGGEGGSPADSRKWAQQNIAGQKLKRAVAKAAASASKRKSKKVKQ